MLNILNITYNYIVYMISSLFTSYSNFHLPHPKYKNKYFVTYHFEGKPYNLLVSKKRGPAKIVDVLTCYSESVIDNVKMYMGPNYDFHNINYTPHCMGYSTLKFIYDDDTVKFFSDDMVIQL